MSRDPSPECNDRISPSRRRVLGLTTSLGVLGTAGCQGNSSEDTEASPGSKPTQSQTDHSSATPTEPPEQGTVGLFHLARDINKYAWYPSDRSLWSRSTEPFDVTKNNRRWLATPIADGGIRCRVENDPAPGNAGFYIDLGPLDSVGSVTVETTTNRSDSKGDQMLLIGFYFDVSGDGDYFSWGSEQHRETFQGLGGDVEALGQFSTTGTVTVDDETRLNMVPGSQTESATLGELKRGTVGDVTPLTLSAIQISVVGSGEDRTEEVVVENVEVEKAAPLSERDWPVAHYDFFNTGHNTASSGPRETVATQWEFETGGAVQSSPVIAHGTVYVGSNDGHIYALDAGTGELVWAYQTAAAVVASPAVRRNMVYVGSLDETFYALNAHTGEPVWTYETEGKIRSSAAVEARDRPGGKRGGVGPVVAFGTDAGTFHNLNPVTGNPIKIIETGGPIAAKPMMIYTRKDFFEVVANCGDGRAYAWIPGYDGGIVNEAIADAPLYSPQSAPHIPDKSRWYRADDAGYLIKFGRRANERWRYQANGKIRTAPVIGNDSVFVGSWDNHVHAVDVNSGGRNWSFETGGTVDSSPAIADGCLYVGSADQHVYGLDATTGERRWAFETGGEILSSPGIADGTIFVGSNDGTVYALTEPAN